MDKLENYLIPIVCCLGMIFVFSGCARKDIVNPSDADIMQARSYLADFDRRMEKADNSMKVCYTFSDLERFDRCKASVYDSVGFDYDVSTELTSSVKDQIDIYKRIAFMPLTTE